MTLKDVVLNSVYRPKANCMIKALEQVGVAQASDLDNLPRLLSKVCGEDVYQVVENLREVWLNPPPAPKPKKTKPDTQNLESENGDLE